MVKGRKTELLIENISYGSGALSKEVPLRFVFHSDKTSNNWFGKSPFRRTISYTTALYTPQKLHVDSFLDF